jgi:hypothetical protein
MRGDVLWPLLFGSALTLVTTLLVQWFSLTVQTRQQREARRADFQRATLIELREMVQELEDANWQLTRASKAGPRARTEHLHANWERLVRLRTRVMVLATGVDNRVLFSQVQEFARSADLVRGATSAEEASRPREVMKDLRGKILWAIGQNLRELP